MNYQYNNITIEQYSNRKGFTLLEMMVAIVVFALVIAAAGGTFISVQQAWQRQKSTIELIQNVRLAMDFMTNELRLAETGSINTNPGSLPAGQLIRFRLSSPPEQPWWFWRGDSASDTSSFGDNSFLYRGQGNNLNQAYTNRQQLANFIVDNPSGNPIFALAGGRVTIELTVRSQPTQAEGPGNRNYTLRTQVRPRN